MHREISHLFLTVALFIVSRSHLSDQLSTYLTQRLCAPALFDNHNGAPAINPRIASCSDRWYVLITILD